MQGQGPRGVHQSHLLDWRVTAKGRALVVGLLIDARLGQPLTLSVSQV